MRGSGRRDPLPSSRLQLRSLISRSPMSPHARTSNSRPSPASTSTRRSPRSVEPLVVTRVPEETRTRTSPIKWKTRRIAPSAGGMLRKSILTSPMRVTIYSSDHPFGRALSITSPRREKHGGSRRRTPVLPQAPYPDPARKGTDSDDRKDHPERRARGEVHVRLHARSVVRSPTCVKAAG